MDPRQLRRDPATSGALDITGSLIVHPAAFWQGFNQVEITHFCQRYGYYCIPTVELVDWLRERIAGRKAIEIGSGSGVLASMLAIPATDSRQQERADMAPHYRLRAPIKYGKNVNSMHAEAAVKYYKPDVVIAAWVTHKYRPTEHWRKGNQYGVDENKILRSVKTYIHIGHTRVHEAKPILEIPHGELAPPWLVSTAISAGTNYICWWGE